MWKKNKGDSKNHSRTALMSKTTMNIADTKSKYAVTCIISLGKMHNIIIMIIIFKGNSNKSRKKYFVKNTTLQLYSHQTGFMH